MRITLDRKPVYSSKIKMRDRSIGNAMMIDEPRYRFYAPERISKNISRTNEGYLLCEGVALARTGTQIYLPDEVMGEVEAGKDGIVRIQRDEDVVFHPNTIASFNGKPFTIDHPDEGVDPSNWNDLTAGIIMNPRRGEGLEDDLMIGDILVTKKEAIDMITDGGIREISCGYDADYEQIEPGRGRQVNIVGNHCALVQAGRAGSRCAIKDRRPNMSLKDRIKKAFLSKDAKALDEALLTLDESSEAEEGNEGNHIHLHLNDGVTVKDKTKDDEEKTGKEKEDMKIKDEEKNEERFKKIEDTMGKICDALKIKDKVAKDAGDDEEDDTEEGKTRKKENTEDSLKGVQATFKDLASRAEILVPGIKLSSITVDSKDPKKTLDAVTRSKRRVLDAYFQTDAGREDLEPFMTGDKASVDSMPVATLDAAFIAVSEMARRRNNTANTRDRVTVHDFGKAVSASDINAKNQAFWDKQRKQG